MKIIKPIAITPGMVTSNVVETHPAWNSTTEYDKEDLVVYGFKVYESLVNNNTNKPPSTSPLDWLLVGPSNCCAAFDTSYSTQSVGTDNITFTVESTELVNSIAVLNLTAPSAVLSITVRDTNDNVVYTKTSNLDDTIMLDMYDYYFAQFSQLQDFVLLDLPPYLNSSVEIKIEGSGELAVGTIILGNYETMGLTQYGVSFGIKDYSLKEENEYGDIVFTERNYAKRMEPSVEVANTDLRKVSKFLASIRAVPTVFIPTEDEEFDTLITYGFLADWNIDIPYPKHSLLRLEVKGLT